MTGINMQTIADDLPDGVSGGVIANVIGDGFNLMGDLTLGIIPSKNNNGGIIGQIPVIVGQYDEKQEVTGNEDSKNIYMNGIMYNNMQSELGADNIIGEGDNRNWINPTHGFLGDLLESAADKYGNSFGLQTGVSKQAQEFLENNRNLNVYMHSQAHLIAAEGTESSEGNGHTYFSYGAPMSDGELKFIFNPKNDENFVPQKNEGDYVAYPLHLFNPTTWSKPGHGTENYGAAKLKKEVKND